MAGLCSPSAWHGHPDPTSCRCCNTPCLHMSEIVSIIILKNLFQINNWRSQGDWKALQCWSKTQVFLRNSKCPNLCTHSYLSPSPVFALPLYSLTFSLRGSSGRSCKISLYFLPQVATEAVSSPGAPECLCSSHMASSCLEVSLLALAHTDLCITLGLFVTLPSLLHV